MIDVETIYNILKQLEAVGQNKISLSDLAAYTHVQYNLLKQQLQVLDKYFNISRSGRAIYISLK